MSVLPNIGRFRSLIISMLILAAPSMTVAKERLSPMKADIKQVKQWNLFADSIYNLHKAQIENTPIRTEEEVGGYGGVNAGDFYKEVRYYNKDTGQLLSTIQWELERPDVIHSIEVFVYKHDRVHLDYSATYLPHHRNAPVHTMVNFYGDTDGLRSFRQFDASGEHIYEQCYGQHFDEDVDISLEDYQLLAPGPEVTAMMKQESYLACFGDMPKQVGKYIDPLSNIPDAEIQLATHDYVDDSSRYQEKVKALSRKIGFNPDRATLYVKRAIEYFNLLELDLAEADLNKAIEIDSKQPQAYFWRGMVYGRTGRVKDGIADLSVFLTYYPDSSLGFTKRGVRYIWDGQYEKAERDLRKALDLNPANAEAHDDLGVLMAHKKELDKAIEHFSKTIKLEPSYQKAYHNRATAYYLQGKFPLALSSVERSLTLKPDNRSSVLLKSEIVAAMGYQDEAEDLRKQAGLLPESGWSEQFTLK